jgi:hypothetical protein
MRTAPLTLSCAALVVGLGVVSLASADDATSYDKEATEVVLKRATRIVKENCGHAKDENGRAVGPWGAAKVTVTLGRNGHSKATVVAPPFDGTPTGKCVVQAFSNLTFPPFRGDDVILDREVQVVRPEQDEGAKSKKK